MKYKYPYHFFIRFSQIYFLFFQLLIFLGMVTEINNFIRIWPKYLLFLGVEILLSLFANFWTDIETNNDGISVNFYFIKIHIKWKNITGIVTVNSPNILFRDDYIWIITAKSVPILYYFYGLCLIKKWVPGIMIMKGLKNIEDLKKEITDRTSNDAEKKQ